LKRIVLTGGPCAGKSSVLKALQFEFAGQVLFVPEVATMLLSSGFPVPGKDVEWSLAWQASFQKSVSTVQVQLENAYELMAQQMGIGLLVTDRGLMDGAGYTPGGQAEFCKIYKINLQKALGRYVSVIHLESLAVGKPELYGKNNNTNRFEALDEAARLDFSTREAWHGHPCWNFLPCSNGIEGNIAAVSAIVHECLKEVEM